jgi:2-dehydro-3-deoxygalactonokinase
MAAGERITADWVAVDWGTSNLRAWAMGPAGPLAEAASPEGMGTLSREGYEPALLRLIGGWLREGGATRVLACGMVGARQGWAEAAYRAVPCTPVDPAALTRVPTADPRLQVLIAPGLSQARPADVMRGEETQIAGVLSREPGFDGVLCLPGTHTKWARISAGEVVSFQTFMTGEMFALLSQQSVLRHGMGGEGWEDAAFDQGLAEGLSHPERIGARLFALRAEGLLTGLAPASARARLSGLLIGAELAGARPYWLGQRVAILGSAAMSRAYARGLAAQGAAPDILPAGEVTLAGLSALHAMMEMA